jgi:hypothetical protein
MAKHLAGLRILASIDNLIRDPNFTSTQTAIARQIKQSDRNVRQYFVTLKGLGAPLAITGKNQNGWHYAENWDFWEAVKNASQGVN